MVIFGIRDYVRTLGIVTFVCAGCQNPAAHRVTRVVRKFTLFFIPLFPVAVRRTEVCTFCGKVTKLSKEQAELVLEMAKPKVGAADAAPAGPPDAPEPSQVD
ncbi:MAG: zinc-ribbon domain-containing protein [Actinomycetia bacterium]|nr:zinc-ribbon domain-containing protein [Actinomycetes bacterium]